MRRLSREAMRPRFAAIAAGLAASIVAASLSFAIERAAAQSEPPAYIEADPSAAIAAFGIERARRIFSQAFTAMRQQAVFRSSNSVPGYDCPSGPPMRLVQVIPYPIKPDLASWIERFVLACNPPAQRNFVLVLEKTLPQVIELLPGATLSDPLLQRDAIRSVTSAVLSVKGAACDKPQITDTAVSAAPDRRGAWGERWSFDLCGTKAEADIAFALSARGGVEWTVDVKAD